MNVGIIVFAYNRFQHLKNVLEGLKKNEGICKLYIFQDGLKCEKHRDTWERVCQIITEIDWCEVVYYQSPYNKGLSVSIVDGINTVFKENNAVVVLEDDCVPHPLFMEYVRGCLEKYQYDKRVFSINGYSWNADVESNGTDAYFIGRTSSWGWATWKDRWELYEQDYKILRRIRKEPEKSRMFDVWGQDLENHLLGNIYGNCDSWAVFWALKCIELGGFCPTPYFSLIDNIGCDGTGVHCGNVDMTTRMRKWDDTKKIALPDKIEFPANYETAFLEWFKWTSQNVKLNCYNRILCQWNNILHKNISIAEYFTKRNIINIAIWGRGDLCKLLLHELHKKIQVNYIIESKPMSSQYESFSVIKPCEVPDIVQVIVVIPIYDMANIQKIMKKDSKAILIGIDEILKNLDQEYTFVN